MIGRLIKTVLITALSYAAPAYALTPMPACDGQENGMVSQNARLFGAYDSGWVIEGYFTPNAPDDFIGFGKGPIPQLDAFNGGRITQCRSGRFIAVDGVFDEQIELQLSATEFLRDDIRASRRLSYFRMLKSARALYAGSRDTRVLLFRQSDETCACREYYPEQWRQ